MLGHLGGKGKIFHEYFTDISSYRSILEDSSKAL